MRHIYQYRHYIRYKAFADLRSEVSRYYISYLWWFLDPILHMLVFYFVFGVIFNRGGPEFVPFLLIGLTTWQWFAQGVIHSSMAIVQSKGIIIKVHIPKIVFPMTIMVTDTFKFLLVFFVLFIYIAIEFSPGVCYVALPFVMIVQFSFTICLGTLLCIFVPMLPDLRFLIENVIQLAFYMSGVFFSVERIPESLRYLFYFNPMAMIIQSYRNIMMYNKWPDFQILTFIFVGSILGFLFACRMLSKLDRVYPRMIE